MRIVYLSGCVVSDIIYIYIYITYRYVWKGVSVYVYTCSILLSTYSCTLNRCTYIDRIQYYSTQYK